LTQRNCAAWSADTNGSSVVGIEATAAGEDGISSFSVRCLNVSGSGWIPFLVLHALRQTYR
jgi:hypothetical protein